MTEDNTENFNEKYRERTRLMAISVIRFHKQLGHSDDLRIIGRQLVRSATSVAANFRAATRGRSKAEYFAKLSIVIEECDETLFWLELLECTGMKSNTISGVIQETTELLKIFSRTRKSIKSNNP